MQNEKGVIYFNLIYYEPKIADSMEEMEFPVLFSVVGGAGWRRKKKASKPPQQQQQEDATARREAARLGTD
jgi:hypothetical protein